MIRVKIALLSLLLLPALGLQAAHPWPKKPLGTGEKLFYNEKMFVEMRQRIDSHPWADALYRKMTQELASFEAPADTHDTRIARGMWAKNAALYSRISGDERYLPEVVDDVVTAFNLRDLDKPLFNPAAMGPNNMYWDWVVRNVYRMAAYDMLRDHPLMAPWSKAIEQRFDEAIAEGMRYYQGIGRLGNTHFWGVTGLGLLGYMRGDKEAVKAAVDGPHGFKQSMMRYRDGGRFWPESILYSYGFVDCCMVMLAEASLMNGGEDLYRYTAPNGASMLRRFHAFFDAANPNGNGFLNGDHIEFAGIGADRPYYAEGCYLFNAQNKQYRMRSVKLDIYNYRFRDPVAAWAISQNPARDETCLHFWGYTGLTHGIELDHAQAPAVKSERFPEMGNVFIKTVQGKEYWGSDCLTLHLRNGASQQFHGNNDHFHITINAFGKNIYPDWFLRWDYLCPRPGRANPTPLSQRIIAHNTVTVDCREPEQSTINLPRRIPEIPGVDLSQIHRSGEMQVVSASGEIYKGVRQKRTLGVTREYVIDIFEIASDTLHRYDYVLHSFGGVDYRGVGAWTPYPEINKEYKLRGIDTKSRTRPENIWLANARKAPVTGKLQLAFRDYDGTGGYTTILYDAPGEVIDARAPYFVPVAGWDGYFPQEMPERKPMFILRRETASTTFYALHQPFKGNATFALSFSREGDELVVKGAGFTDRYHLVNHTYKRSR